MIYILDVYLSLTLCRTGRVVRFEKRIHTSTRSARLFLKSLLNPRHHQRFVRPGRQLTHMHTVDPWHATLCCVCCRCRVVGVCLHHMPLLDDCGDDIIHCRRIDRSRTPHPPPLPPFMLRLGKKQAVRLVCQHFSQPALNLRPVVVSFTRLGE